MNLTEFTNKFNTIKQMGFVRTKRKGPTGVGFTLETLLGIRENNNPCPDIEGAELKAHRTHAAGLITLFTFNNKVWQMPPLEAVRKYGSLDENGRKGLYYTLSLRPNSAGLFLFVDNEKIALRHISGQEIAVWQLATLAQRFREKLPSLLLVSAFSEERNGVEHFRYYRARLMTGTSPEILANQFRAENILVDLRLHDAKTKARNHGTGFRTYENKLPLLFSQITDL